MRLKKIETRTSPKRLCLAPRLVENESTRHRRARRSRIYWKKKPSFFGVDVGKKFLICKREGKFNAKFFKRKRFIDEEKKRILQSTKRARSTHATTTSKNRFNKDPLVKIMTFREAPSSAAPDVSPSVGFIREDDESSASSFSSIWYHHVLETVMNALVLLFTSSKQPSGLPTLPRITKVSKNVVRILAGNPSPLTLQGTNTYLVGSGEIRWLIDTGDGRGKCGYGDALREAMREYKVKKLHGILLTHWHPDHAFGVDVVRKACGDKRLQAFKMVRKEKGEMAVARRTEENENEDRGKERRRHYVDIRDGDVFKCVGATLVAMHTPGHAEDHVCFRLLGDEEDGGDAVFAGDCLMNGSTAEFEDLSAYSTSLGRLLEVFARSNEKMSSSKNNQKNSSYGERGDATSMKRARCYPSHGDVISDGERLTQAYLKHRTSREKQFLRELTKFGQRGATVWELTRKVYGDIVGIVVLLMSCLKITKQHLDKMSKDGTVSVKKKESRNAFMTVLSYLVAILSFGLLGGASTKTRYVAVISNKSE